MTKEKKTARERILALAETIPLSSIPKTTQEQLVPLLEKMEDILNKGNALMADLANKEQPELEVKVVAPDPPSRWEFTLNRLDNGLLDSIIAERQD